MLNLILKIGILRLVLTGHSDVYRNLACIQLRAITSSFSNVLRTFRALKASCQTTIHLFWKADLLTCLLVMHEKARGLRRLMA